MLRMIQRHRHSQAATARELVVTTMADLDQVLLRLPPEPDEAIINEIARIVTTLRTADQQLGAANSRGGMQALDLACARLQRLARSLPELPPEPPPASGEPR
jgi:hypothetical protein